MSLHCNFPHHAQLKDRVEALEMAVHRTAEQNERFRDWIFQLTEMDRDTSLALTLRKAMDLVEEKLNG